MPGAERGEVGLRLIVSMALIAALAWTIPMVFFGRQATDNAAMVTGARDEPGPGSATEAAPAAPIGRAEDVQAQAMLRNAIFAAQVYFTEHGTFVGLTPPVAAGYEPTVTFSSGPATPGTVTIRGVTPTTVVVVTATSDGGLLCAAATSDTVSFGRADASAASQCTGGWE